MSTSLVFQIVNTIVLPAWLVLIFFPGKFWRKPVIYAFSMAMAALYVVYVSLGFGDMDMQSFNTLAGVKQMFTTDVAVLTGWIHYLVFDLLIGSWIIDHSRQHGIPHLYIVPCLFLCFLFGPAGFLLFKIIQVVRVRRLG